MNFVAVIFLACIAIHSGYSSDPALTSSSLSEIIPASEELETCPTNSSISVKVIRNLKGEWLTTFFARNKLRNLSRSLDLNLQKEVTECNGSKFISISGFLMDKDADNSSEVFLGEHRNTSGGEDNNSCKGSIDCSTKADLLFLNKTIEENLNVSTKSSDRISIVENKLQSIEETMNKLKSMIEYMPCNIVNRCFDSYFKGRDIELSNNFSTATRKRPLESEGHSGIISNLPLKDDVAFEIKIDETIDKWKGAGIALGIIVKKEEAIREDKHICGYVPGAHCLFTWDISGSGKSFTIISAKYVHRDGYNLDTRNLPVGTTLGIVRRSSGYLHFLLNGNDKGSLFSVPDGVYAFVDVANYITKVTIIS